MTRYAFDCAKCFKSLQLQEDVYKKAYEGHETCLSCRTEPLQQERLSESDIELIEETYDETYTMVHKLIAEVKRLQSIEETVYDLEASVKLQVRENNKLREVIDKQHILLDRYEIILNEVGEQNE